MDRFERALKYFKEGVNVRGGNIFFDQPAYDAIVDALTLAQQPKAKGSVGEELNQIEFDVAQGKYSAAALFTLMRQHVNAAAEETAHWRSIAITVEKRLMGRVAELEKAAKLEAKQP